MQNFISPKIFMHKNAIIMDWKVKKLCAFYQKDGAFGRKKICAPFCALSGQIRCAFEFRIIKHSG